MNICIFTIFSWPSWRNHKEDFKDRRKKKNTGRIFKPMTEKDIEKIITSKCREVNKTETKMALVS